MIAFYQSLSVIERLFFFSAVIGSSLFLIRIIAASIGGDDVDMDVDTDLDIDLDAAGETDASFQFLSLQGMSAFFMMFGLVGLAMTRSSNARELWAVLAGLAAGVGTVWVVGQVFFAMRRLQSDGTIHLENAVGALGTVYLTIPKDGSGQIQVTIQGSLKIEDARTLDGSSIPTGERVKVVKASTRMLYVEPVNEA